MSCCCCRRAAEACPMGLAPTTSTTMMMALGDALAIALLERKGFSSADFQRFHPGGRLGRRLLRVARHHAFGRRGAAGVAADADVGSDPRDDREEFRLCRRVRRRGAACRRHHRRRSAPPYGRPAARAQRSRRSCTRTRRRSRAAHLAAEALGLMNRSRDHRLVCRRRCGATGRVSAHARLPARRGGMRPAIGSGEASRWPRRSGSAVASAPPRRLGLPHFPGAVRRAASVVAVDRRHSRRVALLKRVLPAIGVSLLLLIAVWPRLVPLWERIRFSFPAIDLRDARELRMVNPRYAGNRPRGPAVRRDRRSRAADTRSPGSVSLQARGPRSRCAAAPQSW